MKRPGKTYHHSALLKKMLAQMDGLLRSGEFQRLSRAQKRSFVHRLRRLMRKMQLDLSRLSLRPAMVAALAALGIGGATQVKAQAFDSTQVLPFNLTPISASESKPTLVDIDGDGDLDLFAGSSSGDIYFSENLGTNQLPSFDSLQVNPFGITAASSYCSPDLVDIDADGDLDLFVGDGYPISMRYQQNIGTNLAPVFDTVQVNPFGISLGTLYDYELKPATADLDGDGDFDILAGTAYGAILYFENTGTDSMPMFGLYQTSPFGISASGYYLEPTFGDLDVDGDLDLGISDPTGTFTYFQNTGTTMAPAFATGQVNPFGIQPGYSYTGTVLADLDGDTDLDLMKGVDSGEFWYQENLDTSAVVMNQPPMIALSTSNDTVCAADTLGPLAFTATDPDSPSLTLTASSTNQAVIADANISISGTAPNYMLTAIPSMAGLADIIITADDSLLSVSDTISVQVDACAAAQPPVVTFSLGNDTICEIDTLGPIAFTATDPDSPSLTLTATSTNQTVIMDANIAISGTAPNYLLTAIPSSFGTADIIVTADDSLLTASDTISVQVDDCSIAIDEGFFAREFEVYPNPADRLMHYRLALRAPVTALKLELVDLQGRVILSQDRTESGAEFSGVLDVAEMSAGIYFLRIRTELYQLNQKVVIE